MNISKAATRTGQARRTTPRARGRQGGYTLAELLVVSGVATMVLGGIMVLLLQTALEQRRGMADATLEQEVATLQGEILRVLRGMSAEQGAVGSDTLTTDQGAVLGFQRLVVARGSAPDFPREALYFDDGTRSFIHDPNLSVPGDERVLMASNPSTHVLRSLYFLPSIKQDGTPDSSLINVAFEIDDNGYAGMARSTSSAASRILRTFSVKMRNL